MISNLFFKKYIRLLIFYLKNLVLIFLLLGVTVARYLNQFLSTFDKKITFFLLQIQPCYCRLFLILNLNLFGFPECTCACPPQQERDHCYEIQMQFSANRWLGGKRKIQQQKHEKTSTLNSKKIA